MAEPIYAGRRPGRVGLVEGDVLQRFLTALRSGSTRRDAAAFAGLADKTVERWMGWGQRPGREHPNGQYRLFRRLVIEAEASAAVMVSGNLVARSAQDTAAALAWLRTRRPGEWQRDPEPVDETPRLAPGGPAMQVANANVIVLSPDQWPDVVHQILVAKREARALAEPAAPPLIEESTHGVRHARLDGLRAETDERA